jgi:hypothetical protein
MKSPRPPLRFIALLCCILWSSQSAGWADTLYTTGFDEFTAGADKIAGLNSWLGSSSASYGAGKSGIDAETTHGVPGLGNAGFLGGTITTSAAYPGNSLNIRRPLVLTSPYQYLPVAANREIVLITALVGIKDSSGAGTFRSRDRFELFIMNGAPTATGSGNVLAAIQFDNTTLNGQGSPQQLVMRTQSTPGSTNLSYQSTGAFFVYDTMQLLSIRINYRTNKWSAYLDEVPLFNDLTFYSGSAALNLGAVGFRMYFGQAIFNPLGSTYICSSGDNYLLIDDLSIEANPLESVTIGKAAKLNASTFSLTWNAEASYRYNVYGSTNLAAWSLLTPAPLPATQTTGLSFLDATLTTEDRKFYQVRRIYP